MRTPPVTVTPDGLVAEVCQKMIGADIGSVIVVSDDGVPVGIVTERDVIRRVVHVGKDPRQTRVADVMSSPLVTVEHDRSLQDAIGIMDARDIKRLAVTRDGQLVGQLTRLRIVGYRPYLEGIVLGIILGTILGAIIALISM
jgi:CBS domain-containing protein